MCNRLKRWKCFQEKNLAVFVSILLIVWVGVSFYHYSGDNYQSNVVADSEPTEYTLTVSVVGSGTTSLTTGIYTEGTVVQASASPNANWTFGYWLLDELNKTANPISVTMNSNHVLTAIFNENPVIPEEPTEYTLTVSVVGSGTTSLTTGTYTEGTVVQASASPNANWTFGYWLLDELNNTANPISVTMNSNHVLTAIFNENPVTFTSTFGVCLQYFSEEEAAAYFPDMWTLVKNIGGSHISGAPRRWVADEAAEHGI